MLSYSLCIQEYLKQKEGEKRNNITFFIGPTGSGKTTSILKNLDVIKGNRTGMVYFLSLKRNNVHTLQKPQFRGETFARFVARRTSLSRDDVVIIDEFHELYTEHYARDVLSPMLGLIKRALLSDVCVIGLTATPVKEMFSHYETPTVISVSGARNVSSSHATKTLFDGSSSSLYTISSMIHDRGEGHVRVRFLSDAIEIVRNLTSKGVLLSDISVRCSPTNRSITHLPLQVLLNDPQECSYNLQTSIFDSGVNLSYRKSFFILTDYWDETNIQQIFGRIREKKFFEKFIFLSSSNKGNPSTPIIKEIGELRELKGFVDSSVKAEIDQKIFSLNVYLKNLKAINEDTVKARHEIKNSLSGKGFPELKEKKIERIHLGFAQGYISRYFNSTYSSISRKTLLTLINSNCPFEITEEELETCISEREKYSSNLDVILINMYGKIYQNYYYYQALNHLNSKSFHKNIEHITELPLRKLKLFIENILKHPSFFGNSSNPFPENSINTYRIKIMQTHFQNCIELNSIYNELSNSDGDKEKLIIKSFNKIVEKCEKTQNPSEGVYMAYRTHPSTIYKSLDFSKKSNIFLPRILHSLFCLTKKRTNRTGDKVTNYFFRKIKDPFTA